MTICTNCNGEGLVGQGENPRLKQGRLDTCKECNGSGKAPEAVDPEAEKVAQEPEVQQPEVVAVDNQPAAESVPAEEKEPSNLEGGSPAGSVESVDHSVSTQENG